MQIDANCCFHVSETANIAAFEPRTDATGNRVVWAIDAAHLANYLLPRDCPRVCFRFEEIPQSADVPVTLANARHVVVVESAWRRAIEACVLYVYAFERTSFSVVDANAGYLHASETVRPIAVYRIDSLPQAIASRGAALRYESSLWPAHDWAIKSSTEFSCIRMRNAKARVEERGNTPD
jgi:hypothetical protein